MCRTMLCVVFVAVTSSYTALAQVAPNDPVAPKIDLNNASLEELESLPGVGKVTAQRIVAMRPITHLVQLRRLRGMTDRRIHALAPLVILTPPRPAARAQLVPVAAVPADDSPAAGAPSVPAAVATTAPRINLNSATLEQLDTLPGIGPVRAQAIVAGRPFRTIQDVKRVKGIGEKTFEALKDRIVVE